LYAVGDLGYSGSVRPPSALFMANLTQSFFSTADSRFLVKSIPRWSESHFLSREMLRPYSLHMIQHPDSLLVRILDFLHAPHRTIGSLLRTTPSHHIVMENLMFGRDEDPLRTEWEAYDLKPASYFYPERDLAGGHLASDNVKERLLDTFGDKMRVSAGVQESLMQQLAIDTRLLEECNVVDYSLFLVRYPATSSHGDIREVKPMPGRPCPWRSGVKSTDGWIYRMAILDFFWAKHKLHARAITGLINAFNLITWKGHMSLTTSADEYRLRFLKMAEDLFPESN
jgi:hypothetical protein